MLCVECGIQMPNLVGQFRNTPPLYVCIPCANKNIGEEKMEANGRVRLNITKNSKGYGFDFTIEQGSGDLKQSMHDALQETQAFKMSVEEMIRGWELERAKDPG